MTDTELAQAKHYFEKLARFAAWRASLTRRAS